MTEQGNSARTGQTKEKRAALCRLTTDVLLHTRNTETSRRAKTKKSPIN